jgi:hypothetical protein
MDNAFQRRFTSALQRAMSDRTKHVIGAVSGSGKSSGIEALLRRHPIIRLPDGRTEAPVLAAVSTDEEERSHKALVLRAARALGVVPSMSLDALEGWLLAQISSCETVLLLYDDSQDFGFRELRRIKKLIDRLRLEYAREIGLCLVVASEGPVLPLRDLLVDTKSDTYRQFRNRFFQEQPWLYVPALSQAELPEVLVGYEEVLTPLVGPINLEQWSDRVHSHLSSAFFDPFATERVTMLNVKNLVLAIARRRASRGQRVTSQLVDQAAEALVVGGSQVQTVDVEVG